MHGARYSDLVAVVVIIIIIVIGSIFERIEEGRLCGQALMCEATPMCVRSEGLHYDSQFRTPLCRCRESGCLHEGTLKPSISGHEAKTLSFKRSPGTNVCEVRDPVLHGFRSDSQVDPSVAL